MPPRQLFWRVAIEQGRRIQWIVPVRLSRGEERYVASIRKAIAEASNTGMVSLAFD